MASPMPRLTPVTRVTGWSKVLSSRWPRTLEIAERQAGCDVFEGRLDVHHDRTRMSKRLGHNPRRFGNRSDGQTLGAKARRPQREIRIGQRCRMDAIGIGQLLVHADGTVAGIVGYEHLDGN